MVAHQRHPACEEQLGRLQAAGQAPAQLGQRFQRRLHAGEGEEPSGPGLEAGDETQAGPGHHPEGAFAPGEKAGEVVAGVVLRQPGHVGQHGPAGQDHLDPDHVGPHVAVAQHPQPAGVGGHHPPDGGRVPGGQVDPEGEPGTRRHLVHAGQGRPGTDRHLAGEGVDRPDLPQPGQAQYHLAPVRDPAAHQPRVSALEHHRPAGVVEQGEHAGHLLGAPRPHHRRRPAPEPPRPVHFIGRGDLRVVQHVRRPHHPHQPPAQRHIEHFRAFCTWHVHFARNGHTRPVQYDP